MLGRSRKNKELGHYASGQSGVFVQPAQMFCNRCHRVFGESRIVQVLAISEVEVGNLDVKAVLLGLVNVASDDIALRFQKRLLFHTNPCRSSRVRKC